MGLGDRRHRGPCLVWCSPQYVIEQPDLSKIYLQTMNTLKRKGILNQVDSWHENNLAQVIGKLPQSKDTAQKFMEIYFSARFGGERGSSQIVLAEARKELLRTVDRFRKQASQIHADVH